MAQPRYTVKSVLVCDDVRQEKSNKHILIGVYNGEIIFASGPNKWIPLCIWIELAIAPGHYDEVRMAIRDPHGKDIASTLIDLDVERGDIPTILVFRIPVIEFALVGAYSIRFGIGRPPRKIADLVIKKAAE
jgi:hypothetical protein